MRLKLPANTEAIHLSSLSLPPAAPPHENNPALGDNSGFVASGAAAAYMDNTRRMLCRNMQLMSYWGGTQALSHPLLFFSFLKCATTHITPQQPTLSMHWDFFPWVAGQKCGYREIDSYSRCVLCGEDRLQLRNVVLFNTEPCQKTSSSCKKQYWKNSREMGGKGKSCCAYELWNLILNTAADRLSLWWLNNYNTMTLANSQS